MKQQYTKPRKS